MGVSQTIHTDEFKVIRIWKYSQLLLNWMYLLGAEWHLVSFKIWLESCCCISVFYYWRRDLLCSMKRGSIKFVKIVEVYFSIELHLQYTAQS